MPSLLIHFARYGPYHHARLRAAAEVLGSLGWEVIGLETAGNDATYAWDPSGGEATDTQVVTVFPGRVYEEITANDCKQQLRSLLDALAPDAIAIAGWASPDARACLSWCRKNARLRILMSETREADGRRVWWKELVKRHRISRFDAALVGGKSHRDYLIKLGMKPEHIAFGYNVVDNAYFAEAGRATTAGRAVTSPMGRVAEECLKVRRSEGLKVSKPSTKNQEPRTLPYFLASNRFIERKNLARLIEAYSFYVQKSSILDPQSPIWNLCLLGDGELKAKLIAQCHHLGLTVVESAPWESSLPPVSCNLTPDSPASHSHLAPEATSGPAQRSSPTVYFPGFRQIDELPRFYAHAGCFVHPALEEPWGLVINEAMACGLPILSGCNVGAAEELVDDGVNGWKFDVADGAAMVEAFLRFGALDNSQRDGFGVASARILKERCPTEAFGRGLAEILKGRA